MTAQVEGVQWHVGQVVDVQPRTWAGINRQGGAGKIAKLHYVKGSNSEVESIDVKYILYSGSDKNLRPHLVSVPVAVSRTKRRNNTAAAASTVVETEGPAPPPTDTRRRGKEEGVTQQKKKKKAKKTKRRGVSPAAAASCPVPATTASVSSYPETLESSCFSETPACVQAPSPVAAEIPVSVSVPYSIVDDDVEEASTSVSHKLEQVYRAEMREAGEFVDGLNPRRGAVKEEASAQVRDEELERFTSCLNELLLKNEGMLEVDQIPSLLNSFPSDQVLVYVDDLCAQNKIMRTDGCIYTI